MQSFILIPVDWDLKYVMDGTQSLSWWLCGDLSHG